MLDKLPPERRASLAVYGGDEPIAEVRRLSDVRTMSRSSLKSCLLGYVGYGWPGLVPAACRRTIVLVPINIAPWLWGWPDRFLNRMEVAGSAVFAIGPYRGGEFSTGLDTREDLARLPGSYTGGIWTNEIETVGRLVRRTGP